MMSATMIDNRKIFGVKVSITPATIKAARSAKKEKKVLEKDIQKGILDYLKTVPGAFFFKIAQGMYSNVGIADIIGVHHGKPYAIEVKRPGQNPTTRQWLFGEEFARAGGVFLVARSVGDVKEVIK